MKKTDHKIFFRTEGMPSELKEETKKCRACVKDALEKIMPEVYINGREEPTEICVILTDDRRIRKINSEKRGIDRPTDVLSFPMLDLKDGEGALQSYDYDPETGRLFLGDIIISVETALRQSEEYGHGIERECAFLSCHGLLHLSGYDHIVPSEEEKMKEITESLLVRAGYARKNEVDS